MYVSTWRQWEEPLKCVDQGQSDYNKKWHNFVVKKKLGGIGDEKMVVQKEIIRYPKLGGGCSEMWKVEKYTSERNHDLW